MKFQQNQDEENKHEILFPSTFSFDHKLFDKMLRPNEIKTKASTESPYGTLKGHSINNV